MKRSTKKVDPKSTTTTSKFNYAPSEKDSTAEWTRDQLCQCLLMLSTRRKMVESVSNKYKTNHLLSNEFSYEEVHGELVITISQVLNAWEGYWIKNGKPKSKTSTIGIEINSNSETKLKYFGEITGYFVNAFKNNISKKYSKFKTDKRSALKSYVHIDAASQNAQDDDVNKNAIEAYTSYNPEDLRNYKQSVADFVRFLRDVDLKENQKQLAIYKQRQLIPMKRKSCLARLFVALMNPRYKGNIDLVKENLGFTDYIFKRNREIMIKKLQQEFKDEGLEMLSFAIEHNKSPLADGSDTIATTAPQKKLEVQSSFVMTKESSGKKNKFIYTVSINEYQNGKWVPVKTVKSKQLIVKPNELTFDQAKEKLNDTLSVDIATAKNMLQKMQG